MECPVCYESLTTETAATSSVPCGHIFHERCLHDCIKKQIDDAKSNGQVPHPDCPTCRKSLNLVHPRTLEAVPKEFRSFYHPSIRRIYLSGVPIDPDEEEAVEKIQKELELESLRASVSQAHEREHATQSQVRSLWNSWTQEKTKNAELQQQLAAAIERERVAKEELRRYEAELRLKRENHSLPSMSSQDPHLGSMFDFPDNDSGYLGVTGAPSYQGFQHWASLASQNNFPNQMFHSNLPLQSQPTTHMSMMPVYPPSLSTGISARMTPAQPIHNIPAIDASTIGLTSSAMFPSETVSGQSGGPSNTMNPLVARPHEWSHHQRRLAELRLQHDQAAQARRRLQVEAQAQPYPETQGQPDSRSWV